MLAANRETSPMRNSPTRLGMTAAILLVAATTLSGCMSGGGGVGAGMQQAQLVWVRTDGQSGKSNPALADQFVNDRTACGISGSTDNAGLEGAKSCMAQRGYVLVSADQAAATAARFRGQASSKYSATPAPH
jgi:hypothetical protein